MKRLAPLGVAAALLAAAPLGSVPPPLWPTPLTYVAQWKLLDAATATISWDTAGSLRLIHFRADSQGLVNLLYPIHDRIESAYDPVAFCTTQQHKQTEEGRRRRDTQIRYDPAAGSLQLEETNLNTTPPQVKQVNKPIPGCVLDLLGALDYVRGQPLTLGEVYSFPVNEGGETAEVRLTPQLRERVSTPAGVFTAIRTEPTVFHNVFARNGRLWVWFSDDARHLPIKIEAKIAWGTIVVLLTAGAGPQ